MKRIEVGTYSRNVDPPLNSTKDCISPKKTKAIKSVRKVMARGLWACTWNYQRLFIKRTNDKWRLLCGPWAMKWRKNKEALLSRQCKVDFSKAKIVELKLLLLLHPYSTNVKKTVRWRERIHDQRGDHYKISKTNVPKTCFSLSCLKNLEAHLINCVEK